MSECVDSLNEGGSGRVERRRLMYHISQRNPALSRVAEFVSSILVRLIFEYFFRFRLLIPTQSHGKLGLPGETKKERHHKMSRLVAGRGSRSD